MTDTKPKFRPSELKKMRERLAFAKSGSKSRDYKKARKAALTLKAANRMVEAGVLKQAELDKALANYADWVKRPREKPKSRATRCSDAGGAYSNAAQNLRDIVETLNIALVAGLAEGAVPTAEQREAMRGQLDAADSDLGDANSEIESLRDEMTSWRDNIEEKFSQTQKYSEVSDAADALDNIEEVNVPELPAVKAKRDAWDSFRDDCDSAADTAENNASEAEGIDFPGMY